MQQYEKPLPVIDDEVSMHYWESCKRHELLVQRCKDCGTFQFFPRELCTNCMSVNVEWVKASGNGTLYSFCKVYRPPIQAFGADVPYVVAIVELEEGVRMMSNLVECELGKVKIGMNVSVTFEDVSDTIALPKFRPA